MEELLQKLDMQPDAKTNYPITFCKYIPQKYANSYLEFFTHWFSHPLLFEDRYDGKWYEFPISDDRSDKEKAVLKYFDENTLNDDLNPLRSTLKICSFTTNPLCLEMWKTYADDSKGICVEYDKDWPNTWAYYADPLYKRLRPMIYLDEKADLSDIILFREKLLETNPDNRLMTLKHMGIYMSRLKDAKYRHEDEWRAFYFESSIGNPMLYEYVKEGVIPPGFARIDRDDLPNTPDERKEMILDAIANRKNNEERESKEDDQCRYGVFYPCPTIPKNIYIGENTPDTMKDMVLSKAKNNQIYVYQVVRENDDLKAELIYEPDVPEWWLTHKANPL